MKFKRSSERKVKANVEMTPLIDVVFQLLIFFMLSSTFVVQTSIPIEIPESEGASQLEQKDLSITLSDEPGGPDGLGKIYLRRDEDVEILDWAELSNTLVDLHAQNPAAAVQIRAHAKLPVERFVKVMGIANAAGIENYAIAAQQPETP